MKKRTIIVICVVGIVCAVFGLLSGISMTVEGVAGVQAIAECNQQYGVDNYDFNTYARQCLIEYVELFEQLDDAIGIGGSYAEFMYEFCSEIYGL